MFLCSCITLNKNKVTRVYHEPLDYKTLADSIKLELADKDGDYIYYQNDYYRNAYIIFRDSIEVIYKLNNKGIYFYHSHFWSSSAYNHLSETFEIILNDSINPTEFDLGVYVEHAARFQIECKSGENIIGRGGVDYLLKQEQPLGILISRIEKSLLRAEQDWYNWKKIRGQVKCIN